ncbi:hemerythrin domain-containing protein [Nonomuraea sp. NPDC050691]|uniref:hemerythrin domain-containing protein n=1 Tax=Nonomuraea sp. NPDC050691 TaxID=3155661 RepID=UPI0034063179
MTAVTPRREGAPEVDLTVGYVEHRAIRADLLRLVTTLDSPDASRMPVRRAAAVRTYIDHLIFATVRHHSIEDEGLWPLLGAATRAAGVTMDLDEFSADHEVLDALLERAGAEAARFAADPAKGARPLAGTVKELRELLERHLGKEEEVIFPAVTRYVSVEDYQRFELEARKRYSVKDLTFMGPWLAKYASRAERDSTLAPNAFYRTMLALGRFGYRSLECRAFGTT